jgi:translation initiation factor 3 subunit K
MRALWGRDKPRAQKSQSSDPPKVFNQNPMDSTATSWITPPTRPELIENLVSGVGKFTTKIPVRRDHDSTADRYNPNNVSILEDYLYHQIRHEEYDCLANLAILKL